MLLASLNKKKPDDVPIPVEYILNINGLEYASWVLREIPGYDREYRIFACCCVKTALSLFGSSIQGYDQLQSAIVTARRMAEGLATDEEIKKAKESVLRTGRPIQVQNTAEKVDCTSMALSAMVKCVYYVLDDNAWDAVDKVLKSATWVSWFSAPRKSPTDTEEAEMAITRTSLAYQLEFRRMCRREAKYAPIVVENELPVY